MTTTTAATPCAGPFAGFAQLLARVQRPRRNPIPGMRTDAATSSACSTTSARCPTRGPTSPPRARAADRGD